MQGTHKLYSHFLGKHGYAKLLIHTREKYFLSWGWVDSKFISSSFYSNPLRTHEEAYLLGKYSLWVHPKYTKPSAEYKLRSQDSVCTKILQFDGWVETNTYVFPNYGGVELHYLNCYRNTKSDFSIKVHILQCILMDSVFIHTINRLFNLGDHA